MVRGPGCPADAPVREYAIGAIRIDITLNRYLDHDPEGRMYVLEQDLERVRSEAQRNAGARAHPGSEPAVGLGLQGDAIQPLTLRVQPGDCLRLSMRNAMEGEPASLHIHGSSLRIASTGGAAIATNPDSVARPGETVRYEWYVPSDEPEGTHYFHSHGDDRIQTSHGLFGAVIVEQLGSRYFDPTSGQPIDTGWQAMVVPPDGRAFREFVIYYHEIGNANYQLLDAKDELVPLVDPLTSAYRPAALALNYRSEPFMNRLQLQQQILGRFDESTAYSSYAFGDPATPMLRSYLGDPVKQRIIHAGTEVFHVHHVHGGSIRWPRQPRAEPSLLDAGLQKHPPLLPKASETTDSQSLGPSETFDVENDCGSGGCQQSVGDYLVHCHVAEHYFAGMWTVWRVYNTLQSGAASTDILPPLLELPGREGRVAPAVTAASLAGTTVDWSGKSFSIAADGLNAWVRQLLPPPGERRGYDASVFDWTSLNGAYMGEPESSAAWPGYRSANPGERQPILFDPKTGKLAYPLLRPHLAMRPPFAPNHGPAPYLDPISEGGRPPPPGANGPGSVCPDGTTTKQYNINAITLPIVLNERSNIVDPDGELYVLREDEDRVRQDNALRVPLALRTNAGEACLDVLLRSELVDSPQNKSFSKADIHIHFVQFDIQASDGVVTGFNYEQSVRPFAVEGETITQSAPAGATSLQVGDTARFQAGVLVGIGMDRDTTFETATVVTLTAHELTFDRPLQFAHGAQEVVSTEFVRYRWYADVQFGTAYFHDHVNALAAWRHGLFGALVAEPPGSTYNDPNTGALLRSGPIADVHTDRQVSTDIVGSFRELVLFIQDGNPLTHLERSTGGSFNLRVAPLQDRAGPPSSPFSNQRGGDPETPIVRAYVGDPVLLRALVGGTNEVHTLHVDGHWFRAESFSGRSPPIDTVHLGISERYDVAIPAAGGAQRMPGDYLYQAGRIFKLREGSWGLLRVLSPGSTAGPLPLPGRAPPPPPGPLCPPGAPVRNFRIAAVEARLPMLPDGSGRVFVPAAEAAAVRDGKQPPSPLVLRANVGDCITLDLANQLPDGEVSVHADMLAYDPLQSGGIAVGNNPAQSVSPGQRRSYRFFASPEVGETVAMLRDGADPIGGPALGLYGAIVVGAPGTLYSDVRTGAEINGASAWQADVFPPGAPGFRDFALFFQDSDEAFGNHRMPYTVAIDGVSGLNYGSEPLGAMLQTVGDSASVFRGKKGSEPATPLLQAVAGDPVRIHVLFPSNEQGHVFSVEGHEWRLMPGLEGSNVVSSVQAGGLEVVTISLKDGAGGPERLPGDYLYGDHRQPFREAGLWGLFRVYPAEDASLPIQRLSCGANGCPGGSSHLLAWTSSAVLGAALLLAGGWWLLRRRARRALALEPAVPGPEDQ